MQNEGPHWLGWWLKAPIRETENVLVTGIGERNPCQEKAKEWMDRLRSGQVLTQRRKERASSMEARAQEISRRSQEWVISLVKMLLGYSMGVIPRYLLQIFITGASN